MDRLAEHEAFLRAIFDAPDEDTPRLVYADFLEDHGDPNRAALIRVQCEQARLLDDAPDRGRLEQRVIELLDLIGPSNRSEAGLVHYYQRGFLPPGVVVVSSGSLSAPRAFREHTVRHHPHWFGSRTLTFAHGCMLGPDEIDTLFDLPFTRQVTEWDLSGSIEELPMAGPGAEDAGTFALIDLDWKPVVTVECVEALARSRNARRVTALYLTDNNLDNDAARALIRSPYLINLRKLDLLKGNRLRGKTWQQLLERFGEDVVG